MTNGVSKKTTYLVVGANPGSQLNKAIAIAIAIAIEVLDEERLLQRLRPGPPG